MNSILYDEFRPRHRRLPVHYRRTLTAGALAIGISALLALTQPDLGPALVASIGLATAGLLLLAGYRGLLREPAPWAVLAWMARRADRWFPATMVVAQNLFIAMTLLPLWWAIAKLGFSAGPALNVLLIILLVLAPLRRILQGTHTAEASAARDVLVEFLRYTFICLLVVFITLLASRVMAPPGTGGGDPASQVALFLWVPCVLVMLGCIVLFLDHLVRKLPTAPAPEVKDTLD